MDKLIRMIPILYGGGNLMHVAGYLNLKCNKDIITTRLINPTTTTTDPHFLPMTMQTQATGVEAKYELSWSVRSNSHKVGDVTVATSDIYTLRHKHIYIHTICPFRHSSELDYGSERGKL